MEGIDSGVVDPGLWGRDGSSTSLEAEPIRLLYVTGCRPTPGTADDIETRYDRLTVAVESNGRDALERLRTDDVECVLAPRDSPDVDGLELLEAIRDRHRHLPVLFYSGFDDEAFVREVLQVEGAEVVPTPEDGLGAELLGDRARHAAKQYRDRRRLESLERHRSIQRRLARRLQRATAESSLDTADSDGADVVATVRETLLEYEPIVSLEFARYDETAGSLDSLVAATGRDEDDVVPTLRTCYESDCSVLDEALRTGRPQTVRRDEDVPACHRDAFGEGDCLTVLAVPLEASTHAVLAAETKACRVDERPFLSEVAVELARALRETNLQADLRRFRNAVEHAGHVVLITDEDARIEYVNPAFEEVTGYDREEAVGRTPAMLQSGEHDEAFYADLWETILAGEVWRGEVVNERKGGDEYVIDQTIAPILDGRDELVGFVAINQNITERKERERDLTFLKRAVDQVGIGIGTYGSDGRMTYANRRFGELLGVPDEEVRGRHFAEINAEIDGDRFEKYWSSFENGETRIRETRIERLDTGETVPVEAVTSRIAIDGESYQVGTVRDVTDRKLREQDLERFRSAVEHAGHGVVITDVQGRIEYVNEAFEEMSGYSAAEAIGRTPAILKSGEHDEGFYAGLWETILAGEVWRGELVNERKDGTTYVIDQTIAPIAVDDGEPAGFVAINNDITELKAYERELERQNERLGQYGQMVAHDLRNPLTLLSAHVEAIRTSLDDDPETPIREVGDELSRELEQLEEVAQYMQRLIEDLLTLAEQGQLVLDAEETALCEVVRTAWREIESREAELVVDDCRIEANPDRLRELLSNLFRNGVEHAGPDVTVRVGPLDFVDGFFVEDDGPGIPPDERDRVLERGFTTADEGTGFGLAVVSRIAEAHEWTVRVTESDGGGARFEFHAA